MSSNTPPECYGLSWSATDPECKGGYTPTRQANGTYKIDPCPYMQSCKARTLTAGATRSAQVATAAASNFIPASALLRPTPAPIPSVPAAPVAHPPAGPSHVTWPGAHPAYATVTAPPAHPHAQPVAPPGGWRRDHFAPSPFVHPYLAVPEPEGVSPGRRLLAEILRAALKAMFQTAAHILDVTVVNFISRAVHDKPADNPAPPPAPPAP